MAGFKTTNEYTKKEKGNPLILSQNLAEFLSESVFFNMPHLSDRNDLSVIYTMPGLNRYKSGGVKPD